MDGLLGEVHVASCLTLRDLDLVAVVVVVVLPWCIRVRFVLLIVVAVGPLLEVLHIPRGNLMPSPVHSVNAVGGV